MTNGATATAGIADAGTVDTYMGRPGRCAVLHAMLPVGRAETSAALRLTMAAKPANVTDLARLTLAADVRVDRLRPIALTVSSLGADGHPNGTLAGVLLPRVAGAWFRYGIDLSTLKPASGRFDPAGASMQISFGLSAFSPDPGGEATTTLAVDNVELSAPSFFVGGHGSDRADGRTEATAFATVQRGLDAAGPGDVVMLLDGTYRNATPEGVAKSAKAGMPAAWITLRAAPGQSPKLVNDGWEGLKLLPGSAYIEVRGLDLAGNRSNVSLDDARADGLIKERAGKKYGGDPKFNGNGISADGREAKDSASRPHHLRFIDNVVHDHCGGGISAIACDYVTAEGNDVRDNCHAMRYGGSGISFLNLSNFDDTTDYHAFVLRNTLFRNRCFVPWAAVGHMSDGNNIIIDVNRHPKTFDGEYHARTLVANNLCVGGGGGGITVTSSSHVDIVNNTLYHNVQTEELAKAKYPWGDLFMGGPLPSCQDVRAYNNVVYAAPGRSIVVGGRVQDYTLKNNVYFGDRHAPVQKADAGDENNVIVDPMLRHPSVEGTADDFRPGLDSPAVGHATTDHLPLTDLTGRARPAGRKPVAGALLPGGK